MDLVIIPFSRPAGFIKIIPGVSDERRVGKRSLRIYCLRFGFFQFFLSIAAKIGIFFVRKFTGISRNPLPAPAGSKENKRK